jgi:hypothetical protein
MSIEVLAKVRPDLTFERPTIDERPIGDDGPVTPTTALNADGLWFLADEQILLLGVLTQMVIHPRRAR